MGLKLDYILHMLNILENNSLTNSLNLLDNSRLVTAVCDTLKNDYPPKSVFKVNYNLKMSNDNLIILMYEDRFIVKHINLERNLYKIRNIKLKEFDWCAADYNFELCEEACDFLRENVFCNSEYSESDIFISVFPSEENSSSKLRAQENHFIKKLEEGIAQFIAKDRIRIIDTSMIFYPSELNQYSRYLYLLRKNNLPALVKLPLEKNLILDLAFGNTDLQDEITKIKEQVNLEEVSKMILTLKIANTRIYTERYLDYILSDKYRTNPRDKRLYAFLMELFQKNKDLDMAINIFMAKFEAKEIPLGSTLKYSRGVKSLKDGAQKLELLLKNNLISMDNYHEYVEQLYKPVIKFCVEEYPDFVYNILNDSENEDKLKDHIYLFVAEIFQILRNKARIFMNICHNIEEAESYDFFKDLSHFLLPDSYSDSDLQKDYEIIKDKYRMPQIDISESQVFEKRTFGIDMLEFLKENI